MAERNSANENKTTTTTTAGGSSMQQQRDSKNEAGRRQGSQSGSTSDLASEFDALKNDLAQVRRDLSNLADAGRSTLTDSARGARDQAKGMRDQAKGVRDQAKGMMDKVRDTSSSAMEAEGEMMDDMRRRVGDHPMTSVAMAMGVGFLVGWIASRSGGDSRDHGHSDHGHAYGRDYGHDHGPGYGYGYGGRYPY